MGVKQEASGITKFRLLMWKNFLQFLRNPLNSASDMLLPILSMAIVLSIRALTPTFEIGVNSYRPVGAYSIDHPVTVNMVGNMNFSHLTLAYSPTSPILEDVLKRSLDTLQRFNNDLFIWIPDIKLEGYDKSDDLRHIYFNEEDTLRIIAAVEFSDSLFGVSELPEDVSYALRFPQRPRLNFLSTFGGGTWRTHEIFPSFPVPGPRERLFNEGGFDPGYILEMFTGFQHAISMELTKRLTHTENLDNFIVSLQRYPHPAFTEDITLSTIQFILPMMLMISVIFPLSNGVKAIVLEKELQLKEAMMIMGLSNGVQWIAWFFRWFIYFIYLAVVFVIILKVNFFSNADGGYAMLTNTPWTILFVFLLVYFIATVCFLFLISTIFAKADTASMFVGLIWFLLYMPSFVLLMDVELSTGVQVLMALSLNVAMSFGLQNMMAAEALGGLEWGNLMTSSTAGRLPFGAVMIILIFDSLIYLLITLYVEKINPGSFGVPQPWYFPFQRSFWCPNSSVQPVTEETTFNDDEIIHERDPTDLPIGIKMTNLTKVFKRNTAVDKLSLNIYDDQITVLLGHNGAGKSTAISMLTGNIKPTSGFAIIAGYDIALQLSSARAHIGFCPQHNILFRELTVQEHLEFFARLKGYTKNPLKQNIDTLVNKLELNDKRNSRANALSGGQKRRLSVGIALCGDAGVVLLDEPTSGMDPASRRALWELLQREKKGRSLILTTHFMDEADYLGDRVAIMAKGRLKCVGSPYFLKQHYGVGYTLVVVKEHNFNEAVCTKTIAKYIPGILVKEDRGSEVTYSFRNEHSNVFESVLNDLENNTTAIGFRDYGLTATTLEDVFMSVGSDMPPVDIDDMNGHANGDANDDLRHNHTEQYFAKENLLTGPSLWIQHVLTIWLKLWLIWSRSWGLIILQIVVPLSIISMNIIIVNNVINFETDIRERPLTLAEGYPPTETWIQFNGTDTQSLGASTAEAFKTIFQETDHMTLRELKRPLDEVYLEEGEDSVVMARMRERVIIGATFSDQSVTAWFSNFGFHDVAVSLATVQEAILRAFRPTATMKVSNHPIEANYDDQSHILMMTAVISMQVATATANSLAIVSAVFIMFYVKERKSRAKLLQMAAGVEPALMWISNAAFDWLWFMLVCFVFILTYVGFQVVGLSTGPEVGRLIALFMIYGAAMLPLNYIFSHFFDKPSTAFSIKYFLNIMVGIIGLTVVNVIGMDNINVKITDYVLMFVPLYAGVSAIRGVHSIGLARWACRQFCESRYDAEHCTPEVMCDLHPDCCIRENPYFEWESPGVARYMMAMAVSCVVFWIIHLLLEYRILQRLFTRRRTPPPLFEQNMDSDVIDEMRHTEQIPKSTYGRHNLISKKLTKYYGGNLAVNQVSFSVGSGECFGLLGVNGAGKTSTFKMLMGDQSISHGDAFVKGHSVKTDIRKVHESLGYCPQFDAVFPELTGRETLRLFALLRGVRRDIVKPLSIHLADSFGFSQHLDKRVREYSGGNKRKLSAAVSMMGYSRLMFLDEPTTGVDPAAKRQVWQAIRKATNAGRSVVLTSHSMEECEALCSRLTIMVNGRFQCLGTPQHLKNKFSQGFALTIKMKTTNDVTTEENERHLQALKDYIQLKFEESELKEEYKGLLSYYLKSSEMQWSQMFAIMELAKRELHVEDYTISQTTLEQIFLKFTKYQRQIEP